MDDSAGKAEQLALTGGEVVAALAHFLIQAVVQLVDEVVSVDIAADLHDFFVRDVILPQDNVAADGAGKEENILQHLSKMAAEGRNFDFADVDAVNQNFALLELVIAAELSAGDSALLPQAARDRVMAQARVMVRSFFIMLFFILGSSKNIKCLSGR